MRLSRLAINNPQFAIVLLAMLALLGVASFLTMPRAEDPQFDFPFVTVVASYPGTSPFDMESLLADPLEEAIKELDDIKELDATISAGLVVIDVEFRYGSDPDEKYDDVIREVTAIRDRLPADLHRLEINKASPSNTNVFQVALLSEGVSYLELERLAEKLEKRFDRLPGIKETEVWGIPEQQVRVSADAGKMQQLGLGFGGLARAVQDSAENLPGGHVDSGGRRLNVRTSGDYESLQQLRETVISADQGQSIRLGDVAEVRFDSATATHRVRQEGRRAIFVTAIQQRDANIFGVTEALRSELDRFADTLPPTVDLSVVFDQSRSVRRTVNGFFVSLLQGLAVVGVIVTVALGLRSASIVIAAIPLSLLLGIALLDQVGFALQQMSIVGLVIVMGLLVDNAIVVVENVNRYLQLGQRARDAALRGASEVASAVSSGTITTVLAFLPLAMLQNNTGTFLRSMPVTVIATLFSSLLIALTATPMMASRMLQRAPDPGFLLRQTRFGALLRRFIARPLVTIAAALLLLLASLSLFPLIGTSLFPPSDKPMFLVEVELPAGSSLDETDRVVALVEDRLLRETVVQRVSANIGRGNPRVFYNEFGQRESPSYGQLFVQLEPAQGDAMAQLLSELRRDLDLIPGALVRVKILQNGPPLDAPVAIRLIGDDLDSLRGAATRLEEVMRAVPGTVNVENPIGFDKVDLRLRINRDKAALLGVSLKDIDRVVRASTVGLPLASYRDRFGEEYDIALRLDAADTPTVEGLRGITVAGREGLPVPLSHLARLELHTEFDRFSHRYMRRAALVTADVLPDYSVARVTDAVIERLRAQGLPDGVEFEVSGEQESRDESFAGIFQALVIAVLGIFSVLVLQFRSFLQPIIIFITLPFALTGALLALYCSGNSLSFMAAIGVTSLMGIVVNNAIILVDFANRQVDRGIAVADAVVAAAATRARPILITTLTTIGGLLPMTLKGSVMYAPMGWVIIGGLIVSTGLTLVLVPVLYTLLMGRRVDVSLQLPRRLGEV